MRNDLLIIGSASVAGGIPEDVQRGIIQAVTALAVWLITKILDRFGGKKHPLKKTSDYE